MCRWWRHPFPPPSRLPLPPSSGSTAPTAPSPGRDSQQGSPRVCLGASSSLLNRVLKNTLIVQAVFNSLLTLLGGLSEECRHHGPQILVPALGTRDFPDLP